MGGGGADQSTSHTNSIFLEFFFRIFILFPGIPELCGERCRRLERCSRLRRESFFYFLFLGWSLLLGGGGGEEFEGIEGGRWREGEGEGEG